MQYPSGVLSIDLGAIQFNWQQLRAQLVSGAECGAVVKADAYGLGMVPVAKVLQQVGCKNFFVVTVQEGTALRAALGAGATISLLQGVPSGSEAVCVDHQLVPVLITHSMALRWLSFCEAKQLPLAQRQSVVKVNTGMNRLGLDLHEFQSLLDIPSALHKLGCGLVMSHLACAEDATHPLTIQQLRQFEGTLALARRIDPNIKGSLANTAATLQGQQWHFDLVRPGIGLYGSNPLGERQTPVMRPVVTLELPVVQKRRIVPGSAVGYGATFVASKPMVTAALAGGYGDGLFRSLGNRGSGWFNGNALPIIGRVSMDSLIVDVTAITEPQQPQEDDMVELLGQHITIDAAAEAAGTVAYEVLTRLNGRYQRRYTLNGQALAPGDIASDT
jgi:alanine racemase